MVKAPRLPAVWLALLAGVFSPPVHALELVEFFRSWFPQPLTVNSSRLDLERRIGRREFPKLDATVRQHLERGGVAFEPIRRNGHTAYLILPGPGSLLNSFARQMERKMDRARIIYDPHELLTDQIQARTLKPSDGAPAAILLPHESILKLTPLTRSTLHEVMHVRDEYLERLGFAPPLRGTLLLYDGRAHHSVNTYDRKMELAELRTHLFNLWWEIRELRAGGDPANFADVLASAQRVAHLGSKLLQIPHELRLGHDLNRDIYLGFIVQGDRVHAQVISQGAAGAGVEFTLPLFESQGLHDPRNHELFTSAFYKLKTEITDYTGRIQRISRLNESIKSQTVASVRHGLLKAMLSEATTGEDGFQIFPTPCAPLLQPRP